MSTYLAKTKLIRQSNRVFVTSLPPYTAIQPMTLNRWILTSTKEAGVDISLFTPYTTRHASSSVALAKGVPIDEIMWLGCWATPSVFIKHYNLPVIKNALTATDIVHETANDGQIDHVITQRTYIPPSGTHSMRKRIIAKQLTAKAKTKARMSQKKAPVTHVLKQPSPLPPTPPRHVTPPPNPELPEQNSTEDDVISVAPSEMSVTTMLKSENTREAVS